MIDLNLLNKSEHKKKVDWDKINDEPFTKTLNDDQLQAFRAIKSILNNWDSRMYLIEGYAGTGKTYLISKIVDFITSNNGSYKVAMTAPTNKAVKVIQQMNNFSSYNVKTMTIHKLLGLKENIDEHGNISFIKDTNNFNTSNISDFDMVIIDESSMLDDTLFNNLEGYCREKILIFIGDPFQIPPIKKADSIPFIRSRDVNSNIIRLSLNKIMRQSEDNPIIKMSMIIRDNIHRRFFMDDKTNRLVADGEKGVMFLKSTNESEKLKTLDLMISYFDSDKFKENSDYVKIIAWTNKRVEMMNNFVRNKIFNKENEKLKQIYVGEKLIANKPIFHHSGQILFNTSDEFEVKSFKELDEYIEDDSLNSYNVKFFKCEVSFLNLFDDSYETSYIKILNKESEQIFTQIAEMKKQTAISTKDSNNRKAKWKEYYNFLNRYANVNYNYAITAHKSQGSTYNNVFIIESDINKNDNIIEKNRILYTACTRPTNILYYVYE